MGLKDFIRRKKTIQPQTRAEELNPAEKEFLGRHRARFRTLATACGIEGDPAHDAPRMAGEMLEWWREQAPAKRGDANDLVFALGTALGDYMAPRLGMRWMVVTDPFGTSLSLYAPAKGQYEQIVLSPIDSVAKRFESGTAEDLTHYVGAVMRQVAAMKGE